MSENINNNVYKFTQANIALRRERVLQMTSEGKTQQVIADSMNVNRSLISLDLQYLREKAKDSINEYVTEKLPEQYLYCLTALNTVIRRAIEIADDNKTDTKDKLAALQMFSESHFKMLELLGDSVVLEKALHYVKSAQNNKVLSSTQQQQQQEESNNYSKVF